MKAALAPADLTVTQVSDLATTLDAAAIGTAAAKADVVAAITKVVTKVNAIALAVGDITC